MEIWGLYNAIKDAALATAYVEQVTEGDVYDRWNNSLTMRYGAVNVSFTTQTVSNHTVTHSVVLYYGDRLTEGGENKIDVWETGVAVLRSVLNALQDVELEGDLVFNYFEQKFADMLAGVWCEVRIESADLQGECDAYED